MRFLIKTFAWGMVVLALIGVAAPAVIGWVLATRFDRIVAQLSVPGYLTVVSRNFDQGWFRSHARVVLKPIGALCHTRPCPVLTLDSRIDHGPLAWGADQDAFTPVFAVVHTRADPTELWPRYVFSPTPGPLKITSRIGLDTRGQATLHLTGVTFDVARQNPIAHLETATVSGELDTGVLGRGIDQLALDWPSFSMVRQTGGHLGWRGLHFTAGSAPGGMLARRSLTAESLTLDNGEGRATRLNDLRVATRGRADGRTTLSLHIRKLVLPDSSKGTFILEADERGLKPAAWAALPGRWQQLGGWSGGALNAPALYRRLLPDLLAGGTALHVKRLELAMPDGAIRASGKLDVPASPAPADTAVGFLSALDLHLRVSLPRPVLRRLLAHTVVATEPDNEIDAGIAVLVGRDLIAPSADGKRYIVRVGLHDGQMTINGRDRPKWRQLVAQFQAAAQGL